MRRVIYTAIIGAYDAPPSLHPAAILADCDYLCFCDTDVDLPSPWQLRRVECLPAGPAVTNRRIKFCAGDLLAGYDQALYMDGNVDLKCFPAEAFRALDEVACVFIAHPQRDSVLEELVACVLAGKLSFSDALALRTAQSRAGFDDRRGLTANRLFAYRPADPAAKRLLDAVYEDYLRGPMRDQLHLPHALQRLQVRTVVLSRQWALETFSVRSHSGADPSRGRVARVLRRIALAPLLSAVFALVARFNHLENPCRD